MIIQKTLVNQVEIVDGATLIRLELCVFNGDVKIVSRWHRSVLDNTVDPAAQFEAINSHLGELGEMPIPPEDIADVCKYHKLRKTVQRARCAK